VTKKNLYTILFLSFLLILILFNVNREHVTIDFSKDDGVILQDHKGINNLIDFYVDGNGNYYYLDYYKADTYMYKVSSTGKLIFKKKLPDTITDFQKYYKKIIADEDANIYVSVTITPRGSRYISKEIIQKYDYEGNHITDIYEISLEEPLRMGNPFSAFSSRLINIQLINDKIYAFDKKSGEEIILLEINPNPKSGMEVTEKKILKLDSSLLREIIYTANDEVYFLNRHAQIWKIDKYNSVEKIDTKYNGYSKVIPNTLSADQGGHLYFTDIYNKKFVKLDHLNGNLEVYYDLSQDIDKNKNITLNQLRKIKVFGDNKLVGHSMTGLEGNNYFATLNDDGIGIVVDKIKLNFPLALKAYGLWVALIFAGVFLSVLSVKFMSGRIGLLTKQMLIFLPIFLAVMLGLVFFLSNIARNSTIESSYEKIATVAEMTSKLMDGEKFKNLNQPEDDFGPEYMDIVGQVKVNSDDIYYVTYFVEDNQIFVGVSTSIQSYTPIEYIYDEETVQAYYDTIHTGNIQQGSTIDSLGEWMFALAPIKDANGQIVGVLEHGLHAGQINEDINNAVKNLVVLVVGIALAIAVAYILMLKYSLRALNVLKLSVAEVAAGRWNTKVDIQTKDEFRDIGAAFNKMSDHIQEYIDEITQLNKAYIKFVPEEFFKLLGKKNVLEVQLGEQVMEKMNVMHVNIRNIEEQAKKMDIKENYHFINKVLEVIAKVVNENEGVIERFEGAGVIALFKNNPKEALGSALRLMEELSHYKESGKQQVEVGISISSGQILLGIVGHENRLATTVISDEVHNARVLEKISAKLGIKLLLTQSAVDQLANLEKYNYRYGGRVKDKSGSRIIEIYEFLDGCFQEVKTTKLMTKSTLEEGIAYYQAGNFSEARKKFISVIRVDREDKLAKTYLFLCEKYNNQKPSDWEGVLEYF